MRNDFLNSFVSETWVFYKQKSFLFILNNILLREKDCKQLTLGRMISKDPVIRLAPERAVNTLRDRALWSEALGLYGMAQKEPYVNLETRVLTKWSR